MTATAGRPATEYTVEGFDEAPHPGVEVARGGSGPSMTLVSSDTAALVRASLEAAGAFAPPMPSELEVAGLLDRWFRSLTTGRAELVMSLYAPGSVLLPTLSGRMRVSLEEKLNYLRWFVARGPIGAIDRRVIQTGLGWATDTGHYTFFFLADGSQIQARYTFTYCWDGQRWLIASHHSSVCPDD